MNFIRELSRAPSGASRNYIIGAFFNSSAMIGRAEAHHGAARASLINAMTELMAAVDVGGLPLVRATV